MKRSLSDLEAHAGGGLGGRFPPVASADVVGMPIITNNTKVKMCMQCGTTRCGMLRTQCSAPTPPMVADPPASPASMQCSSPLTAHPWKLLPPHTGRLSGVKARLVPRLCAMHAVRDPVPLAAHQ